MQAGARNAKWPVMITQSRAARRRESWTTKRRRDGGDEIGGAGLVFAAGARFSSRLRPVESGGFARTDVALHTSARVQCIDRGRRNPDYGPR